MLSKSAGFLICGVANALPEQDLKKRIISEPPGDFNCEELASFKWWTQ